METDLVAVITGAGQGIGAQLARRFGAQGYTLHLIDRNDSVMAIAGEVGGTGHVFDLTDDAAVATFAAGLARCDVLVNNAALTTYEPLLECTTERASAVFNVNVLAPLSMIRALITHLQASQRASVINFSSITATYHPPSTGFYSTSKAAVEALTKALAVELGPLGVRVNAIAPGTIPTEGSASHYGDAAALARRRELVPLQRLGTTDEIADGTLFLASEASAYISGQILTIDGGHTVAAGRFYRYARNTQ